MLHPDVLKCMPHTLDHMIYAFFLKKALRCASLGKPYILGFYHFYKALL